MKTISVFPGFETLTEREQEFYDLLHEIEQDSLWRDGINIFLSRPSLTGFRQLVKDLKSQCEDDTEIMKEILGEKCFQCLSFL